MNHHQPATQTPTSKLRKSDAGRIRHAGKQASVFRFHFILNIAIALMFSTFISGCADTLKTIENQRLSRMSPLEQNDRLLKQMRAEDQLKADEALRVANLFLAEKRRELSGVSDDLHGLWKTSLIAYNSAKEIDKVRGHFGLRYTWPQMVEFVAAFRIVRDRQLAAVRPLLIDDSGKTAIQDSGFNLIIHHGIFADTQNPIVDEAILAQRKIHARNAAEARRLRDKQADEAAAAFMGFLQKLAEAKQKEMQDLMDRGICPHCRGKGTITITSDNKCYTCVGSGFTYVKGGICRICAGMGTIGIATSHTERCGKCAGSGKYEKP